MQEDRDEERPRHREDRAEEQREREKAKAWWDQLSPAERHDLGDELVLGAFDWTTWGFSKAPSSTFLNEVDDLRMHWESEES